MKIAVIGTGYVGLVAGACFAETGTDVTCVDVDEAKLELLKKGEVPFFEPGLSALVKRNWPDRLHFSTDLAESIRGRDVVFVAVGTPPSEDGSADLSHVLGVAKSVAQVAERPLALVLKSTVPVGTNAKVREVVRQHGKTEISVVSNPEFLKEGDALNDFLKPDRIVVGADDERAFELLERLYLPFNRQRRRLHRMSPKSAEIVKYAANAMLATKISFMNEIAGLCDAVGADVEHVRLAVGADRRIGYPFLYPGLGFGGSCFPKDLRALVHTGQQLGVELGVSQAAVVANRQPVARLVQHMAIDLDGLDGKRIAIWGVAFKPRTDDVREAPAIELMQALLNKGAKIAATDPEALETGRARLEMLGIADQVELSSDPYKTAEGASALVLATEWQQFSTPDVNRLAQIMAGRFVFDGRNVWDKAAWTELGFTYRGMGRR